MAKSIIGWLGQGKRCRKFKILIRRPGKFNASNTQWKCELDIFKLKSNAVNVFYILFINKRHN